MDRSNHQIGHRSRLREKFLKGGRVALADYEMLEMLLTYSIPRKDTKPIAKNLLSCFGNFAAVFDQPEEKLRQVPGLGKESATLLLTIRSCLTRYLEQRLENETIISSPEEVLSFVRMAIGANPRECLMILCLNAANRLVHHEVLVEGTVDQAPVYPREILKPAIIHNATAFILVHNHPSGRALASEQDRHMTEKIASLASEFNITLHDHLIVSPMQAYSIKIKQFL